jgi:hypothetical protein
MQAEETNSVNTIQNTTLGHGWAKFLTQLQGGKNES